MNHTTSQAEESEKVSHVRMQRKSLEGPIEPTDLDLDRVDTDQTYWYQRIDYQAINNSTFCTLPCKPEI